MDSIPRTPTRSKRASLTAFLAMTDLMQQAREQRPDLARRLDTAEARLTDQLAGSELVKRHTNGVHVWYTVQSRTEPGREYVTTPTTCTCAWTNYHPARLCHHRLMVRNLERLIGANGNQTDRAG